MILSATPAFAQLRSETPSSISVNSGSWGVQALAQNQLPTNSAYTITWSVNKGTAYSYFSFRNTGTFTVTGFQVGVTQVQIGGSGKPQDTTFDLCSGGSWDPTTNTCSGTVVNIGSSANLILSLTGQSLISGAELSVRASTKPNLQNAFTTTLSVSVDRTQVRSGSVLSS